MIPIISICHGHLHYGIGHTVHGPVHQLVTGTIWQLINSMISLKRTCNYVVPWSISKHTCQNSFLIHVGFSWRSIHPESFHIELLSGCRLSRVFGKQHVPENIEKQIKYILNSKIKSLQKNLERRKFKAISDCGVSSLKIIIMVFCCNDFINLKWFLEISKK